MRSGRRLMFMTGCVATVLVVAALVALASRTDATAASPASADAPLEPLGGTDATPTPPTSADSSPAPATGAAVASAGSAVPFAFTSRDYALRDLPMIQRQFCYNQLLPRRDRGVHDRSGVRMARIHGRLYNCPRSQATYGLVNLNSYLVSHDDFYLERALKQARRLVVTHRAYGGAWFYPYYPSRHRHGVPGEMMRAPWYSGLAQGRVLMFFSRLAEVTGAARWRDAADRTFESFLRREAQSGPCVVDVDSRHYLWLQEWPWTGMRPDCTFNGHNAAAFGLYEYWHLTGDARTQSLLRGALTTAQRYAPVIRRPGWISRYCLAHSTTNPWYHRVHVTQLLCLYQLTGVTAFAVRADAFSSDYPNPAVKGRVSVAPGRYEVLRFDGRDQVVARRTIAVPAAARWTVTRRQRHRGRDGAWLRVTSGPAAGWWLRERAGKAYLPGIVVTLFYDPARRLDLAAGRSYAAVDVDDRGRVLNRAVIEPESPLTLHVSRSATVNGALRLRLSDEEYRGYWLTPSAGVTLH